MYTKRVHYRAVAIICHLCVLCVSVVKLLMPQMIAIRGSTTEGTEKEGKVQRPRLVWGVLVVALPRWVYWCSFVVELNSHGSGFAAVSTVTWVVIEFAMKHCSCAWWWSLRLKKSGLAQFQMIVALWSDIEAPRGCLPSLNRL